MYYLFLFKQFQEGTMGFLFLFLFPTSPTLLWAGSRAWAIPQLFPAALGAALGGAALASRQPIRA